MADTPPTPEPPAPGSTQIGVDRWVSEADERHERRGFGGRIQRLWGGLPPSGKLALLTPAIFLPFLPLSEATIYNYGLFILIYALLALGLNVVVGYAGLLDLGYVAFFGFGAYVYAMLASPKFGLHWATLLVVPLAVVLTAILGLLAALPPRRLIGAYLAICPLFFGQLFVTVFQNGESMSVLGFTRKYDVTGGPNGITDIDNFNAFGLRIGSLDAYYYV